METKRKLTVMLTIDYQFDDNRTEQGEAEEIAKDLALRPCFDTIINGVSLNGIGIEELDY